MGATQYVRLRRWRRVRKPGDYGSNKEEQIFGIALELCITWMNRILFLKLLEEQLIKYHGEAGVSDRVTSSRPVTWAPF